MNDYGKLLDEVKRLNSRKMELEKEIKTLEKQIKNLQTSNFRILEECKPIDERIKNLRRTELELNHSLNQLQSLVDEKKNNLNFIESEREKFSQFVVEQKNEIANLTKELTQKNLSTKDQIKAVGQKKSELDAQIAIFQLKVEEFNKNFKLKTSKLTEEQNKLIRDRNEFEKLKDDVQNKQSQLTTKLELCHLHEVEIDRLKSDLERKLTGVNKREKEISTEKEKLLEWEKSLQQLSTSLEMERDQIRGQKKEAELDGLRVEKLAREKGVDKELKELKSKLAVFGLIFCLLFSPFANADDEVTVDGGADVQARKNSVLFYEKSTDPSNPFANGIKLYAKDNAGTTALYTVDSSGTVAALGAGGSGDVTAVGDCTTGACFDGTQGTTLTFNGASDGTITYGTNFAFSKSITLNSGSTVIGSTGTLTLAAGTATTSQFSSTANSLTSGTTILGSSSSNSMTGRILKASYTGTSTGNVFEAESTSASSSGIGVKINQYGTGDALQINDVSGDTTPTIVDASGNLTVGNLLKLRPTSSPPGAPASGDLYVDSDSAPDELCFYDGTGWQGLSSGTDANCA